MSVIKISFGQYVQLSALRSDYKPRQIDEDQMTASMLQILGDEICDAVVANQERGLVTEFALKSLSEYTEDELDEYGYAGLVQIGFTPQQARNLIASRVSEPVLATFRRMKETAVGREQLARTS